MIDLCTRMVVGWQMATHLRTSLVVDALDMARVHGHLGVGAVFHADRGTQYTSAEFSAYCEKNSIRRSVGRTGVCWDNAVAESFFATLKNEMYHLYRFATRARARFAVAEYIEVVYNRKRRHSTLGYRRPRGSPRRTPQRSNRCLTPTPEDVPGILDTPQRTPRHPDGWGQLKPGGFQPERRNGDLRTARL